MHIGTHGSRGHALPQNVEGLMALRRAFEEAKKRKRAAERAAGPEMPAKDDQTLAEKLAQAEKQLTRLIRQRAPERLASVL
jgi:hypothetical protein